MNYDEFIKDYENRIVEPHATHNMTEWAGAEVRTNPFGGGTPRFHSVRMCSGCESEQAKSAAGSYSEKALLEPCYCVEVEPDPSDVSTFDFMLGSHHFKLVNMLHIYANQYAVQNIKELPGVFEVGTLGAIWFTEMWNGNRDRLYVDSDPSWKRFIDQLADWIYAGRCSVVFFYWP